MRSTKLAVSVACVVTAGIGIGVFLGATWLLLGQTPEVRSLLGPELLRFGLGAAAAAIVATILPIWIIRCRINESIAEMNRALSQRRASSKDFPPISSSNCDREYQTLVSELNTLVGAVKESQKRLDHYAAKVAHELRAPITLLQLQLDYAAKHLDPQFVDAMTTQIRRLTDYVDTALFIAKVTGEKIRPARTRQKIADVVREIAGLYKLQAAGQKRKLSIDVSTDQEAEIDEKVLGLILHNLMSNAFSHGLGETRLRLLAGAGKATLLVVNRVCTKASAEPGTGIGLRTVAVLTQAHKGLKFRSRRIFNSYAAVLEITTLAASPLVERASLPPSPSGSTELPERPAARQVAKPME